MPGAVVLQPAGGWSVAASVLQAPVWVVLSIVASLAVLVGVGWYLYALHRSPAATLRARLARVDTVSVLMHPNPDPDAMACALGVERLAESVGTEAVLQYPGEIRHQENRAFRTVLDLELERIETDADLASEEVVLVDHNAPRGFEGARGVEPFAVIDHHPGNGEGSTFTDVRTHYGASSSIIAEYFKTLDATRHGADGRGDGSGGLVLDQDLATGLMYGIQSDTNSLTNGCAAADFEASSYLYPAVDEDELDRIANPLVDVEVIDVKKQAITGLNARTPNAISDVGEVGNVDAIPQAANELIRIEHVANVVVVGEHDGVIHLSARSRDDRVHVGRMLERAVEDIPMADAGGHARMGGGQISIGHMHGIGPSDGLSREELHERLFDAMEGTEQTLSPGWREPSQA